MRQCGIRNTSPNATLRFGGVARPNRSPIGTHVARRGHVYPKRSGSAANVESNSTGAPPKVGPITLTVNVEVEPRRIDEFYKAVGKK